MAALRGGAGSLTARLRPLLSAQGCRWYAAEVALDESITDLQQAVCC